MLVSIREAVAVFGFTTQKIKVWRNSNRIKAVYRGADNQDRFNLEDLTAAMESSSKEIGSLQCFQVPGGHVSILDAARAFGVGLNRMKEMCDDGTVPCLKVPVGQSGRRFSRFVPKEALVKESVEAVIVDNNDYSDIPAVIRGNRLAVATLIERRKRYADYRAGVGKYATVV